MADAAYGSRPLLVVGAGMAGLSAAAEAAEAGFQVILVEREPYLGGRVAGMNRYFPKLCPPACGLEINFRRIGNNPRIRVFTMTEVEKIEGDAGDFEVTILVRPRYVKGNCTGCGVCQSAARSWFPNPFNYGLDRVKAIYLPHEFAYPLRYVLAPEVIGTQEAKDIRDACPYGAVDLEMQPERVLLRVGAVVWATGWSPYEAEKIPYYGYGKHRNVVNNLVMERLASPGGPTGGRIVRPSDGGGVQKVAFVQCAGSRDENHLAYCSHVCCLASLKQATYVLDQYPGAEVIIFYIDIRALGRHENFFRSLREDKRVRLVKGKAGELIEDPASGRITIQVEDQSTRKILKEAFDLVVLATGMVPNTAVKRVPSGIACDDCGFVLSTQSTPGIIGAGCVTSPLDVASCVQNATAAALKAVQILSRR
ncbi:MAG: CoB--CoM heterodisulfide reductase iron-sulfur subunit A family protein [Syntrophobacteraceae bacterium]|nr:CoB--CoM heterodisulfide reductase iron-sulfur subunit A family protein [Syntrophobacteraceae bacterium]